MKIFSTNRSQRTVAAGCCRIVAQQQRSYRTFAIGSDVKPKSLYERIGIKGDEALAEQRSSQELKLAFIRTVRDAQGDDERVRDATEAYSILTNTRGGDGSGIAAPATLRHNYAEVSASSPEAKLGIQVDGGGTGTFHAEHVRFDFSGAAQRTFGDYTAAFESATGYAASGAKSSAAPVDDKARNGHNVQFLLKLTFTEAFYGCTKEIEYNRMKKCRSCAGSGKKVAREKRCVQCSGRGFVQLPSGTFTKRVECSFCAGNGVCPAPACGACRGVGAISTTDTTTVTIPAGAANMSVWTVRGRGDDGVRGGTPGKLLVTLLVEDHRIFHRVGLDLHVIVPVPLSVALLGGVVDVPTLLGTAQARVPPGAHSGRIITLDGLGVRDAADGDRAGHIKAHLLIVYPNGESLTGRQVRAIGALLNQQQQQSEAPASPHANESAKVDVDVDSVSYSVATPSHRATAPVSVPLSAMAEAKKLFRRWLPGESDDNEV